MGIVWRSKYPVLDMADVVLYFFCIVVTHYLQPSIVELAHLSSFIVSSLCTVVSPTGRTE
jgi:hypothetical protein